MYHDNINSLTVAEVKDGSNTIKVSSSTRPIEIGDKIFYQNFENRIVNVEGHGLGDTNVTVTVENPVFVTEGQNILLPDFNVSNNNTE